MIRFLLRLAPVVLLAACGQTGALYLPDEGVATPVEVRPATAPAPTPTAPAKPKDEEKDGDQPQGR